MVFDYSSSSEKEQKKKPAINNKHSKAGLSKKNKSKIVKNNNVKFDEAYLNIYVSSNHNIGSVKSINRNIFNISHLFEVLNNCEQFESISNLPPEDDFGTTEYKLKLIDHSFSRLHHLTTQMKFRLEEGFGECMYYIGVSDNGELIGLDEEESKESISAMCFMASQNKAEIYLDSVYNGVYERYVFKITVKKKIKNGIKLDLRILIIGGYQVGKTSLLGVLSSGKLDNGTGIARMSVMNHKHEVLTGVTSSISYVNIFFNSEGDIIEKDNRSNFNTWEDIIEYSSKIITFIDIGGHKKYKKTLIHGCLSTFPDYSMIVLNILDEDSVRDNINLAFAIQTKFFIVITHLDKVKSNQEIFEFIKKVINILSDNDDYIPITIRDIEDCVFLSSFVQENIIPIFAVV